MSHLVKRGTAETIISMAIPMFAGTFAINVYNLTNAWFVSRLGTDALAAISFAFPVIMLLSFVIRSIGMGSMALVSHALGSGRREKASEITFHASMLALLAAVILSVAGILTIKPLFIKLGASGEALRLTEQYMRIWYLGSAIMVLQMLLSDIVVSTGVTKAISALMVAGTVVNLAFDYALIFGKFGFPGMGITGAAIATIISQAITLAGAYVMLRFRLKLISPEGFSTKGIFSTWKQILKFAVPGALGMIMGPVSAAIITKLVAAHGNAAVAAVGVAGRIEMFAFMIPMTVGMSLIPFVGQNYGAGRIDRIWEARKGTMIFAGAYGVALAVVFFVFSTPMAGLFSQDAAVVGILSAFIRVTCFGYGFLEIHRYAGFCLTGMHMPLQASVLDIVRVVALLLPLSILGDRILGIYGIFWGRLVTDLGAAGVGILWSSAAIKRRQEALKTQHRI